MRDMGDHKMLSSYEGSSAADEGQSAEAATLTIPLPEPLRLGETEIGLITLREPTLYEVVTAAKKVRTFPNISPVEVLEAELELVRQVSGLSDAVFSKLPASVVRQARDYVVRFEEEAREQIAEQIEGWGDNLPAERTLSFSPAISGGGQSWDSMTLRSPTVGQMRPAKALLKKPSLEALFRSDELLITSVSGWPKAAVLRLPASRYVEAAGYLNAFFPMAAKLAGHASRPFPGIPRLVPS